MAWRLMGFFWRMPKAHPTASTVITGLCGIALFIQGIAVAATPTSTGGSSVAGGILICILGLVATGLAAYAAFQTQYFQSWTRPDGTYGHKLVRWAGPVFLIVALIELIVVLWIVSFAFESTSRR